MPSRQPAVYLQPFFAFELVQRGMMHPPLMHAVSALKPGAAQHDRLSFQSHDAG
jgi:hypothetical protein